ncbi:PREDICTED: uncharacterized protein LOC105365418 [Ceratosolen solmsi marchali]|uniref:Uncharacterized protein LOC105365418 n=1 Tax=Ceratosolen solmsi marchali TaxID=326594 RepID=A0AAJ6YPJ0_9HYME|nr:PREDICTED: uncharacterized protein LOC105365418 [Ceratosolen solmsi marchali]
MQYISATTSTRENVVRVYGDENASSLTLESEDEVRERYRRLIPYMTYYLVNNYVGLQHQIAPSAPNYADSNNQSESPVTQRPVLQHLGQRPTQPKSKYPIQKPGQENRFVPSVQYDPKELTQDADYFVPVNYGAKDIYDYPNVPASGLPQTPVVSSTRYEATSRPVSTLLQKQKQPLAKAQHDYVYREDSGKFESIRFASPSRSTLRQQPVRYIEPVTSKPTTALEPTAPRVSLNHILKSLQLTNQLPEVLSKDNIDSSIKTLVEILNILNMGRRENYAPIYEKPAYAKPKVITESNYEATQIFTVPRKEYVEIKAANPYVNQFKTQTSNAHQELVDRQSINRYIDQIKSQTPTASEASAKPSSIPDKIVEYYIPIVQEINEDKVTVNADKEHSITQNPQHSIHNDDITDNNDEILEDEQYSLLEPTEEQKKKLSSHIRTIAPSLKYGATRGKPHVDYPAYTEIPETEFSCKQQRYKGFFGDPATGCQVWHYCDLNGGKSSFLCPNGTIFSQVALTCDWWFNVKCESTTQLYVLNERLYKYILPIMPKFPEDFTGPEVDKYLELKFKEMEAKLKEKKMKKEQEEKGKSTVNTLQSIEDSK